jgi:hypothetical protein
MKLIQPLFSHTPRAVLVKSATSMSPPTKSRLPVTSASTGLSYSPRNLLTSFTACSIEGKMCTFSLGNAGVTCDHAFASSVCVPSVSRSAGFTEADVNSGSSESVKAIEANNEQPTGLPLAARIGDICAEYSSIKEGSRCLRIACSEFLFNCTQ